MRDSSDERDPIEEAAEEFAIRIRRGASTDEVEFAASYPEIEEDLLDLLPSVRMIEELKRADSRPRSDRSQPVPDSVGDYRVIREIARGGMGIVYEAEQRSLGRRVALKVLPEGSLLDPTRRARFEREAKAAGRLHHTNIVPVFGVGEDQGVSYYAMQYIPGCGLDQVLRELRRASDGEEEPEDPNATSDPGDVDPSAPSVSQIVRRLVEGTTGSGVANDESGLEPLTHIGTKIGRGEYWRRVARLGLQAAQALDYAHSRGTLHRDIKPANLLIDEGGTVWVADFGLAKLDEQDDVTGPADVVGTVRYMAPERFEGAADARSDIYSLGLTLYEFLALRPAFRQRDRGQLAIDVLTSDPPRPSSVRRGVPVDLETIVLRSMAKEPERRYESAGAMAEDLEAFLSDRPIAARRTSALERSWRWCRRNKLVASLLLVTALSLLSGVAIATIGYVQTARSLERAEATVAVSLEGFERIYAEFAPLRSPQLESSTTDLAPAGGTQRVSHSTAKLLERMLTIYDRFADLGTDDPHLQREAARATRRVGDILLRLGKTDEARQRYETALARFQMLEAEGSLTAVFAGEIPRIHNALGDLYAVSHQPREARAAYRNAIEVLEKMHAAESDLPEMRYELAHAYSALGREPAPPGRSNRRSNDQLARAIEMLKKLVTQHADVPEYRHLLASCYLTTSLRHDYYASMEGAVLSFESAVQILEALVEEFPDVADYRHELVRIYAGGRRDRLPRFVVEHPKLVERYLRALDFSEELTRDFPGVAEYASSHGQVLHRLGSHYTREELYDLADEMLGEAVAVAVKSAQAFPKIPAFLQIAARARFVRAAIRRRTGFWVSAKDELLAAIDTIEAANPDRLDPGLQHLLSRCLEMLSEVCFRLGDFDLAVESREAADSYRGDPRRGPRGGGPGGMRPGGRTGPGGPRD
ncbi:MAG: protein kinase [Planctomycetota bacterium]